MRRLTSIFLATVILTLGSGALEYVHNLAHALEDALEDRQLTAAYASTGQTTTHGSQPDHHHDESNCPTHAQLHMAMSAAHTLSPPLFTGVWQSLQRERTPQIIRSAWTARLDCRGPPAATL